MWHAESREIISDTMKFLQHTCILQKFSLALSLHIIIRGPYEAVLAYPYGYFGA